MQLYGDIFFVGGRVYTADPHGPRWVESVVVRDGHILAAGPASVLSDLRGPRTEIVDLRGQLLVPGFTESHVHFIELALRAAQVDVTYAKSAGEVATAVAERLAHLPEGAWVRGGGWNANIWTDGRRPHRRILDEVAPDIPVALDSKELHAVWANTAALERAGINRNTANVPGGVIERDASGEPTGLLQENAMELLSGAYPKASLAETTSAVTAAIPHMWQSGIVALHNANDDCDALSFRTYQALHNYNALGLRVLQHIPACNLPHARGVGLQSGLGDRWLRVGGVKMFADGALGSRTASMLQPFTGEPDNWGVTAMDPEEMLEQALAASQAGFTLTIHAIGDRANRDVLDILGEVRRQENGRGLRHRVEHVQLIHDEDLPRLAQLDIIASVQPIHATSDMLIVDRYWGSDRAPNAYPFRRLLDFGTHLVFGSDGPIEPHAPLLGIHAATTRRREDGTPGPDGWQTQERIKVGEAVDAYTYWPAYAAGEESYRGSIAPGKVADLAVLSQDIFRGDPHEILKCQVEMTVLNGEIVWRQPE